MLLYTQHSLTILIIIQYQFPVDGDATKEREVEEYQQKVKEKEEKISDLTEKLQAQETVITQLKEQANSQPTEPTDSLDEPVEPTDSLDEAVIEMMEMTRELADAKSEKQKAYRHMLDARQRINFASDPVNLLMLCAHCLFIFWGGGDSRICVIQDMHCY